MFELDQVSASAPEEEDPAADPDDWEIAAVRLKEWFHGAADKLRAYDPALGDRLENDVRVIVHGQNLRAEFRREVLRAKAFLVHHRNSADSELRFPQRQDSLLAGPAAAAPREPTMEELGNLSLSTLFRVLQAKHLKHLWSLVGALALVVAALFGAGYAAGREIEGWRLETQMDRAKHAAVSAAQTAEAAARERDDCRREIALLNARAPASTTMPAGSPPPAVWGP
jgi:hypothetical protein